MRSIETITVKVNPARNEEDVLEILNKIHGVEICYYSAPGQVVVRINPFLVKSSKIADRLLNKQNKKAA